jgi:radical SAM superfamily enzyme YgiQ (UPF0313 family)
VLTSPQFRRIVRERLAAESGRLDKEAPFRVALTYPSPYSVGMSSLGFQQVYRGIQALPGITCERVFLEDEGDRPGARVGVPLSYEGLRPLTEFPVIAVSVAYEIELAGLIRMLDASGIPPLREDRDERHPLIIAGGPLTFSNPVPLGALVDAVVMGESEDLVEGLFGALCDAPQRAAALDALAQLPHVWLPDRHGTELPSMGRTADERLPAHSAIRTPHTELSGMFLVESERGCSRGCMYCVMRRSTNGGMRIVPAETVIGLVPEDARRVGLVGAAVSDHPKVVEIVRTLAESGREVGLSSLRPDKLSEDLVSALVLAGHRTLTTALDGPSERLRGLIERRGREPHYVAAAERARRYGMDRLKLYLMIGLPGETDADIDECASFVSELSRIVPIALGVAPFCAKRNTPLDRMPFAGVTRVEQRLARLRRGLQGRADLRGTSARWAWVEYVLAQGGLAEGRSVVDAVRAGGRYADFKKAFAELGHTPDGGDYVGTEMPVVPERVKRRLPVRERPGAEP